MKKALVLLLIFLFFFSLPFSNAFSDKKGKIQQKLIVLTFDDGPRPKVLLGSNGRLGLIEVLESMFGEFIPAHFFVIGGEAKANPRMIKILSDKGFLIENHTYGHENLLKLRASKGDKKVLDAIEKADNAIFDITGRYPKYFRPPFWAINGEIKKLIENKFSLKAVYLGDPDINTLDYDDYSNKRPVSVLTKRVQNIIASREKQGIYKHVLVFHELPNTVEALAVLIPYFKSLGYRFGTLDDYFGDSRTLAENEIFQYVAVKEYNKKKPVKAVYLAIDYLYNQKKISYLENLIDSTELNAIVIDFKVGKPVTDDYMRNLIARFKNKGVYVIGRLVVFQDSYLAKNRPDLAIKDSNGNFCYSGRKDWQRYWVDMSSSEVWDYNIEIAQKGIDLGFDEINFDYIRFPSDFGANCDSSGKVMYPVWKGNFLQDGPKKAEKYRVMEEFYFFLNRELKSYASVKGVKTRLSIDIFGEVFLYGEEPGIGQRLSDMAKYFDVIAPMAYPSHYKCKEFGVKDPNAYPYLVYKRTLEGGLAKLKKYNFQGEIRPWIQSFSLQNIYDCGPFIKYGSAEIKAQIQAGVDLGIDGFMLWNGASNYIKESLLQN